MADGDSRQLLLGPELRGGGRCGTEGTEHTSGQAWACRGSSWFWAGQARSWQALLPPQRPPQCTETSRVLCTEVSPDPPGLSQVDRDTPGSEGPLEGQVAPAAVLQLPPGAYADFIGGPGSAYLHRLRPTTRAPQPMAEQVPLFRWVSLPSEGLGSGSPTPETTQWEGVG